jgi:uncharacterized membrane protein
MVNSSRFFWFFLVNGVLFLLVFLFFPETYDAFSREDHVIENATAIALLLAGVLLIRAGIHISPQNIRRYSPLLLIVGLIFIIGAGEEISWGQRIFNWETPEALAELNDQNETNLHNINKKFFDRLVDRVTILFVFFASFLLLRNKKSFKGIPYPDGFVILAFAITPFYHQYNELVSDFYFLLLLPLLALLIYGWQANKSLFRAVLLTFAYLILMSFTHYTFNEQFADHNNSANEYREFLFALACLFYAYQIKQFKTSSKHE